MRSYICRCLLVHNNTASTRKKNKKKRGCIYRKLLFLLETLFFFFFIIADTIAVMHVQLRLSGSTRDKLTNNRSNGNTVFKEREKKKRGKNNKKMTERNTNGVN